ncbi:MAG: helix-turn-helix domain-containing protein [Bacteroidota bacterium]
MKAILRRIELLLNSLIEAVDMCIKLLQRQQQPAPVVIDELIRAEEVMQILSISRRTLYNYTQSGFFVVKRIGGTKFYCKASVMRLK